MKIFFINFFIITIFFVELNFYPIKILDSKYPVSLTLNNGNILLVTQDKIIFYDSLLENIINNYTLEEYLIANNEEDTYKTIISQYSKEYNNYILLLINNYLFILDEEGQLYIKKNMTSPLNEYNYYHLTPYKKIENELYYIISGINKYNSQIDLFYYKININTSNNNLKLNKSFIPKTPSEENFLTLSYNIECQIMKSFEKNNILTCFYGGSVPSYILINSFDLENNLQDLDSYSNMTVISKNINYIKIKCDEDKSTALIGFINSNSDGYIFIYDINSNKVSSIKKLASQIALNIASINLEYFELTKQYVLSFRSTLSTFTIILFDINFNIIKNEENEKNDFSFDNNYFFSFRDSIIYLNNENCYAFLTDLFLKNQTSKDKSILIYPMNIKANISQKILETIELTTYNEKDIFIECDINSPYLILESKICTKNCSVSDFFNNICKINNQDQKVKEDTFILIENEIKRGNINSLLNSVLNGDNSDLFANEKDIIYQITTSENQKNKEYTNISTMILDDCENRLREKYNISKNGKLIILKADISTQELLIPIIKYKIFNSETFQMLNLSYCDNLFINISIPILIDEKNLFKYDPTSDYYNSICFPYTTENKTDIIIKDRRNEFINNKMSLCEEDCKYNGYDLIAKKAMCECPIKIKQPLINEIKVNKNKFLSKFVDINYLTNLVVMKCYHTLFCKEGLIINIGSYILLLIIILYLISLFIFYLKGYNLILDIINKVILIKNHHLNINKNNIKKIK